MAADHQTLPDSGQQALKLILLLEHGLEARPRQSSQIPRYFLKRPDEEGELTVIDPAVQQRWPRLKDGNTEFSPCA